MKKGISRRQFIKISISGVGGLWLQGPFIGLPESNAAVIKSKNNPPPEFFLLKPTFKVPDSCKVLFFQDEQDVLRSVSEKYLKYEGIFPKDIPQIKITILRPVDLVNLKLETKGFALEKKGIFHKNLVLAKTGEEHFLKFIFPPQHIVEEYYNYEEKAVRHLPFDARLVGESRLVFDLNKCKQVDSIPLTIEKLLEWDNFQLSVVPVALPNLNNYPKSNTPTPEIRPITDYETLIELPFGMLLSPHLFAGVAQNNRSLKNSETNNYTELWHASITPLGMSVTENMIKDKLGANEFPSGDNYQTIRAVGFLMDKNFKIGRIGNSNEPFPFEHQRNKIVAESSNFNLKEKDDTPYNPRAIHYTNLKLSSLGAYAKLHGNWPVDNLKQLDIEEWQQETVWGRDQFVRIQEVGYIMPWGHKVLYIQILKRYMLDAKSSYGESKAAYLVFRKKCIIKEKEKVYEWPKGEEQCKGLAMPFKQVTIVESETPYLTIVPFGCGSDGKKHDCNKVDPTNPYAFWMQFEDTPKKCCESDSEFPHDFKFTIEAKDWQGNTFTFKQTLVWVRKGLAENDTPENDTTDLNNQNQIIFNCILDEYCKCEKRRNPEFNVQKLAFYRAEADNPESVKSSKQDDAFDTIKLDIRVDEAPTVTNPLGWSDTYYRGNPGKYTTLPFPAGWQLRFYPAMNWAKVKLDGVAEFSPQGGVPSAEITYNDLYLKHGFNNDKTKGGIYLDVAGPQMNFGGDKSGGSATPSINIRYISKLHGPVGGKGRKTIIKGIREVVIKNSTMALAEDEKISDKILGGVLDAKEFFAVMEGMKEKAKLLGDIGLKDVVAPIADITKALGKVPQLIREKVVPIENDVSEFKALKEKLEKVRDIINDLLNRGLTSAIEKIIQTATSGIQETVLEIKKYVGTELNDKIDRLDKDFKNNVTTLANIRETALHEIKSYLERPEINRFGQTEIDTIRKLFDPADIKLAIIGLIDDIQNETKELYNNVLNEIKVFGDKIKAIVDQINIDNVISGKLMKAIDEFKVYIESFTNQNNEFVEKEKARLTTIIDKIDRKNTYYTATVDNVVGTLDEKVENEISKVSKLCHSILDRKMSINGELDDIKKNFQGLGVSELLITNVVTNVQSMVAFRIAAMKYDMQARIRDFCNRIVILNEDQYKADDANIPFTDFNNLPPVLQNWYKSVTGNINTWVKNIQLQALNKVNAYQVIIKKLMLPEYLNYFEQAEKGYKKQILQDVKPTIDELIGKFKELQNKLPKEIKLTYDWEPELKSYSVFQAEYEGRASKLTLHTEIIKSLVELPRPPETRVLGVLTDFQINLLPSSPFLMIGFKQLRFESINGSFKVDVEIGGVKFGEALSFIEKLAKALSPNSGFFLELANDGLKTGYRFAMPALITGEFNCFNLSINAAILLPFKGGPIDLSLSICQRNRPFMITVGIYGGGGFFGITLTPKGVKTLEGSMEFGAATVLEIAGASGHASITAGIYFSISKDVSILTGFTRAAGDLRIINLVNICMEFYVGLQQEKRGSETYAVGEARLTVEIEIGFFHTSRELTYRKKMRGMQGSGGMNTQGMLLGGTRPQSVQENFPEASLNNDEFDEEQWQKDKELYAW